MEKLLPCPSKANLRPAHNHPSCLYKDVTLASLSSHSSVFSSCLDLSHLHINITFLMFKTKPVILYHCFLLLLLYCKFPLKIYPYSLNHFVLTSSLNHLQAGSPLCNSTPIHLGEMASALFRPTVTSSFSCYTISAGFLV